MEPTRTPPARSRPRRCNADYRWTLRKALAFFEALALCGEVAEAARTVGMSRQSAYQLRARLAGGPLGEGFELARREGLRVRAARSRSRWEGPGIEAVTVRPQADARPPQADGPGRKLTHRGPK